MSRKPKTAGSRKKRRRRRCAVLGTLLGVIMLCAAVSAVRSELRQYGPAGQRANPYVYLDGKAYDISKPSGSFAARSAAKTTAQKQYLRAARWEQRQEKLLWGLASLVPDAKPKPADPAPPESFLAGTADFTAQAGGGWQLGYAQRSLRPADFLEKDYFVAGNFAVPARKFQSETDEIKLRTVCLDDGTGRGLHVFAALDCIGLSNHYVRALRGQLAAFIQSENIASLNVFSTHAHSSIDTMGIWSRPGSIAVRNWVSLLFTGKQSAPGADLDYLDFLLRQTGEAVCEAVAQRTPGKLYFSQIGLADSNALYEEIAKKLNITDETEWTDELEAQWEAEFESIPIDRFGMESCLWQKRYYAQKDNRITKLRFAPDDPQKKETVIANFAAHPYTNGLNIGTKGDGDSLSADFPFYMEQLLNEAGANLLYINGAVSGAYPERGATASKSYYEDEAAYRAETADNSFAEETRRMGRDFGSIALALGMDAQQLAAHPLTRPDGRSVGYRAVYERLHAQPVTETFVPPLLNVRLAQIDITPQNPLQILLGKLNLAQTDFHKNEAGNYIVTTEIGCLELGGMLKMAMVPGELAPELLCGGGETRAESAHSGKAFAQPVLAELAGEDVLVLGLANDALGYIIPDNNYMQFYLGNGGLSRRLFGCEYTHYQELLSLGENCASTLMAGFEALAEDAR